ncbi:MAG: hypothetical protein NC048_05595 [Bacteroides sp.]|nr:hypothetical protein [Ruminococcus flavefaciens]MCM1554949.1 hypothetical protein [Bacteroides sp.]
MKTRTLQVLSVFFILSAITICCKKAVTEEDWRGRSWQQSQVRMEIKNRENPAKAVGIVGDSVSVRRLARWGYAIFATISDRAPSPGMEGVRFEKLGTPDFKDFLRDTVECVYSFAFWAVYMYNITEKGPDGIVYGEPGSEVSGWLLWVDNPVVVAFYDTIEQQYLDPNLPYCDANTPDWHFGPFRTDTIGYIPQSLMEANYPQLQRLYREGRYSEMEELMRTGYTIYTCTSEEYRELVRQGLN